MKAASSRCWNHGVSTGALFLAVGMIYERTPYADDRRLRRDRGPRAGVRHVPHDHHALVHRLPGTNGFIGEFAILLGAFQHSAPYAVIASIGIVLGAGYMLWLYQRIAFGTITNPHNEHLADMNVREVAAAAARGPRVHRRAHPNAAFSFMHASVSNLIQHVNAKAQVAPAVAQIITRALGN